MKKDLLVKKQRKVVEVERNFKVYDEAGNLVMETEKAYDVVSHFRLASPTLIYTFKKHWSIFLY